MTDLGTRAQQLTPLHARTSELCATNLWVEECGFTVPALYTSPREEHEALTTRVALSDLSARQSWLIEGPDAAAFLAFATLADAARIEPGQTARTLWCDDQGHVRGEGMIARFAGSSFELSTLVRDFAWMADGVRGFDVKLVNATGSRAIIGVRGPRAQTLLAAAGLSGGGGASVGAQPGWRPAQVALVRGAVGDGFELWMEAEDATVVWDRLWRFGAGLGIAAAGAATLEAARIENAVPKAGVDWLPAHLALDPSDLRTPLDLGFALDPTRRFNGADALRRSRTTKPQVLAQLVSDDPLTPGPITMRNATVGRLTSAAWSESRAAAVALAWLEHDAARIGSTLAVQGLKGPATAEITREVFAA
jgi:aminomethyltransferase